MAVQQRSYTVEEFMELAQSPDFQDKQLELIDGELIIMPPSSGLNSQIAALIVHFLLGFVLAKKLGYVTGADGGYRIAAKTVLVPDVAFISKERAILGDGGIYNHAPDLAVEVISPSETPRKVTSKARRYLLAGTKLVWAVFPSEKLVDVYRLTSEDHLDVETVGFDGTLDAGDALPGFTLPVKDIFPEDAA